MLKIIDYSYNTVFQRNDIEIDKKSQFLIRQLQIGQQLFMMNILQCFNRFDFNNYFIVNDNIQPKSYIKPDFCIYERNSTMISDLKANFF